MSRIRLITVIMVITACRLWLSPDSGLQPKLRADDLNWAERSFNPQEKAPEGLRNNISLEMINAIEGRFEPRFQHYFRDSMAYYLQLQFGSNLASGLNFAEEFQNQSYNHLQLGFELGLTGLLYARNSKVTKDVRRWGSGLILGLGLRFMFSNLSREVEDNILSGGLTTNLGWRLQSHNFSVSMYLQFRILLQFSTKGAITKDLPIIIDRGPLSRSLPDIPIINSTQTGNLSQNAFYTFSQTINIRIGYYF
ncbi:hypothetical protein P0082_09100 [Candidatus Haliotispira prima]|uniref:Outer membrane protein beta-barrel domain-containing protein n=1 Tax=Candidatus Haliotispira prima TaxID=3034016 RepID=A0ABY8MF88_9SPIO|nr:hypothetical protein P0082_09100 [Candidatus Haliotispira prima]